MTGILGIAVRLLDPEGDPGDFDGNDDDANDLGLDGADQPHVVYSVPTVPLSEITGTGFGTGDQMLADLTGQNDHETPELKFGARGGCDCGYNPNSCGAGWACRWQY